MLDEILSIFSDGKAKAVCIFGAGMYGIELYYDFIARGIRIRCFIDNDISKKGYLVDDTYCFLSDDLTVSCCFPLLPF